LYIYSRIGTYIKQAIIAIAIFEVVFLIDSNVGDVASAEYKRIKDNKLAIIKIFK
jgi:hypothetical protein